MRTGIAFSIRYRRYFTSSKVCSGAFVLAFTGSSTSLPQARSGLIRFPIIATARGDAQISALHGDLQSVEAILGGRDILGIEANQILRPEFAQDLVEGLVELCTEARRKNVATSARGERCERVFPADVAACIVGDWDHQHRVQDGIGQLRGLERLVIIFGTGGVAAV